MLKQIIRGFLRFFTAYNMSSWGSFDYILDFVKTEMSKSHDPLMSIIYVTAVHDRSIFNNMLHGLWELSSERNNKAIVRFENP